MEFSLAYIKSNQQFIFRHFSNESDESNTDQDEKGKIIDLENLREQELNAVFLGDFEHQSLLEQDKWNDIEALKKFIPIRNAQDLGLTTENFAQLTYQEARALCEKINAPWVLANNLRLIEGLFGYLSHLNRFWPNDRTNFFEELWFIIRSNLGTTELTLIYNDLKKAQSENEKNKLTQIRISGGRVPSPVEGGDAEKALFKHYEKDLGQKFQIIDWNKEKGELSFCFTIYQGPVLVLAKTAHYGQLQHAVLSCLIDGINHDKNIH